MNVSLFDAANEALDCGDASKAFRIFMQDVKNGGMDSLNSIGFLYDHGQGVKKNRRLAIQWYRLAASKGYFVACFNLGLVYKGAGRKRSAKFWFKKAYAYWAILTRRMNWGFYMHARHPGIYFPADQLDIFWQRWSKNI